MTINSPKFLNNTPVEKLPIRFDKLTTSSVYPEIWNITWGYSSQDWGTCVALDNKNDIIVGGSSPNSGESHIFLVKYNSTSLQLWNKTWSKASHDEIYDIVLDNENNIYATGRTGPYGATGKRMLLIKFNATGDEVWHVEWTGSNDQGARAIVLDSSENIYVSGRAANNDSFIRKYNSDGLLNWSKEWGGGGSGYEDWPGIYGMTIDKEDNIYITGRTINLGPGGMDMFLLKYNFSGDLQWAQTWGYLGDERGYDVDINSHNDLFVTVFSSTANTLYLVKYNSSGSQVWNRTTSTFSIDGAFEIDINSRDMIFVSGTKPDNNQDIFLLVLDYDGGIYSYYNWSLSGTELGLDMILDENNEIYLTGLTNSIGAGNWDMLLVKYSSITRFKVDPIHINDTATGIGANNWIWARSMPWCSGSGTYNDPYFIKNLEIDGGGTDTCIWIENSNTFFKIENCTFYNAASNTQAILISYASNGKIMGNNVSYNNKHGITLWYSENITIIENNVYNNGIYGIYLKGSNNTIITKNNAFENTHNGLAFNGACNNLIYENNFSYNTYVGINMYYQSHNNTIFNNTFRENGWQGVYIKDPTPNNNNYNKIYRNKFIGNNNSIIQAWDNGYNNQWDNGIIGNYWSDYGGVDTDDNGIGDTPYGISGSAGSLDYLPIWNDGDDLPPTIKINLPLSDQLNGAIAPLYNVEIFDPNLDTMWYTIDGGVTNIIFSVNGTIDQNNWTAHDDGPVTIIFYANDTLGHINSAQVIINKDIAQPTINIITPLPGQLFGTNSPDFTVEIYDLNLDTMWYTIDGGVTNITFSANGTIDQNNWTAHIDGPVTLTFYANDTLGRLNSAQVIINKDVTTPIVNIISPNPNQLFGSTSPDFIVEISRVNLDTMWYTIDGGLTNITFTFNGTINQASWNLMPNGTITIKFYANNTLGKIAFQEVIIRKDVESPIIYILSPTMNEVFEITPAYEMTITEANLDKIWYTFDGGTNIMFITELIGVIDLTLWNQLPNGYVTIRFYANDTLGNISFDEVIVVKDTPTPSPPPGGIPGFNVIMLLGMISLITAFIIKWKFNKGKERNP